MWFQENQLNWQDSENRYVKLVSKIVVPKLVLPGRVPNLITLICTHENQIRNSNQTTC